jgi:hypothetical protein
MSEMHLDIHIEDPEIDYRSFEEKGGCGVGGDGGRVSAIHALCNMYASMYVCIYVCMAYYIHNACMHADTHKYIYMHACIYTCMHIYMHACMHACE